MEDLLTGLGSAACLLCGDLKYEPLLRMCSAMVV